MPRKKVLAESYVLRELAQIKALADPLRQRLLRAFAEEPRTTKQVAHNLKENATKLYHHVDTLADAGLLKLIETRQNRGTIERYYQAAAKQFAVDRNIFRHLNRKVASGEKIMPDALFESAFTSALTEIRENLPEITAEKGKAALLQARICGTPAQAIALREKIQRLIQNQPRGKRTRRVKKSLSNFEIVLAIYPVRSRRRRKNS